MNFFFLFTFLISVHNCYEGDHVVVEIDGGVKEAKVIAESTNHELLGEVLPGSNFYHLRKLKSERVVRSADHVAINLSLHPQVRSVLPQNELKRVKRDDFEEDEEKYSEIEVERVKREGAENDAAKVREQCYVSTIPTEKAPSKRCVFPFEYKGSVYERCTSDHSANGKQWCATSVARDGEVIVGEWGDCDFANIECRVLGGFEDVGGPVPRAPALFPQVNTKQIPLPAPVKSLRPPPAQKKSNFPPVPFRLPMGTRKLPATLDEFLLLLGPRTGATPSKTGPLVQDAQEIEDMVGKNTMERFTDKEWPRQWYLNRGNHRDMNVEEAWDLGFSGAGVTVTILDDGVEWSHPDLSRNYREVASYDINQNDKDPFPRYDLFDTNKHGTRCAGQVAAEANNSLCSVGVAFNAGIGGVRMLDGTITDAVEARSLSLNPQNIDIYSASWGPDDDGRTVDGPGPLTRRALQEGVTRGREGRGSIYVWASGNGGKFQDNCNCDGYATSIFTLSVSSASENGNIPWYSEQCSSTLATTYSSGSTRLGERKVVTTDLRGRCTASHTGTSASSPMAAAIVALVTSSSLASMSFSDPQVLEANPKLTWRDVQHIVVRNAKKANLKADDWTVNGAGLNVSHAFGFGLMDAGGMVKTALRWEKVPMQKQCQIDWEGAEVSVRAGERKEVELMVNSSPESEDSCRVRVLEHVHVALDMASRSRRGEFTILLRSPMGTESQLLAPRPLDQSIAGFSSFLTWPLMTTHSWGESPGGIWTLIIINGGSRGAYLRGWRLITYGTEEQHNL